MVGQAFADEIFYVCVGEFPEEPITYQDANRQVENMIVRAELLTGQDKLSLVKRNSK
jgi:hypothetical protein